MNIILSRDTVDCRRLPERRRSQRHRIIHILVITGRGTGQVMEIGPRGLSFGCLYPHSFPETLTLDILDARGSHIKGIPVRKIWERGPGHPDLAAQFELEVGVSFLGLTDRQAAELESLLENLDLESPDLLKAHLQ